MSPSFYNKISKSILWVCMLVTIVLSAWFYYGYMTGYEMVELQGISALLYWMYVIMGLAGLVTLIFSVFYFVIHWKNRKKKSWKALTFTGSLGVLLLVAYLIGNGIPLSIIGYTGSENTYLWLKLTDMWIYSLYVLLVLTFLAVIGGILWSLLKK